MVSWRTSFVQNCLFFPHASATAWFWCILVYVRSFFSPLFISFLCCQNKVLQIGIHETLLSRDDVGIISIFIPIEFSWVIFWSYAVSALIIYTDTETLLIHIFWPNTYSSVWTISVLESEKGQLESFHCRRSFRGTAFNWLRERSIQNCNKIMCRVKLANNCFAKSWNTGRHKES